MIAGEHIKDNIPRKYWAESSVRAHVDPDTWWHVHNDEELPADFPCTIYINLESATEPLVEE